jgi:dihydrofolate reductase
MPASSADHQREGEYVVSHSLAEATWQNTTLVPGDGAAERIRRVKAAETDGDIAMSGSATTVRWLQQEGLLDELRLLVHPVVVGKGQRLFEDTRLTKLTVLDQKSLGSGVQDVSYPPA